MSTHRPIRGLHSLYGMAERGSVVTNPAVASDDREQCRLVPQESRSREMNRVQGANRLSRKRTPGIGKDRLSDTDDMAP